MRKSKKALWTFSVGAAVSLGWLLVLGGCGSPPGADDDSEECIPGRKVSCRCEGRERNGFKKCRDDSTFGPCKCRGGGDTSTDVGVDASTDSGGNPDGGTMDTGRATEDDGGSDTGSPTDGSSSDGSTDGHRLPLAANWNSPEGRGFSPQWQIDKIREGHHLLFTYRLEKGDPEPNQQWRDRYKPIFEELNERDAPLCMRWGNWLDVIDDRSASSPVDQWRASGKEMLEQYQGKLELMQKWYPDPPYIVMLSNNEGQAPDNGEAYIERYRALFDGMREGAGDWGQKLRFIGYVWGGQANLSIHDRNSSALAWDGTSARNYRARSVTDHTAYSTQANAMNLVVKKEYYRIINPPSHFEISTWWDGKTSIEPDRYGGLATWSLWVARPHSLRDFASWGSNREDQWPYYSELVAAVDQVHDNPTLRAFWRNGQRVVNEDIEVFTHVIDAPPGEGSREDGNLAGYVSDEQLQYFERLRHNWYHLPTSLDPPDPEPSSNFDGRGTYPKEAEFGVWAQAKVLGEAPERRWLVFTHAPRGDEQDVEITIPEFKTITLDVPQNGVFAVVDEQRDGVVETISTTEVD